MKLYLFLPPGESLVAPDHHLTSSRRQSNGDIIEKIFAKFTAADFLNTVEEAAPKPAPKPAVVTSKANQSKVINDANLASATLLISADAGEFNADAGEFNAGNSSQEDGSDRVASSTVRGPRSASVRVPSSASASDSLRSFASTSDRLPSLASATVPPPSLAEDDSNYFSIPDLLFSGIDDSIEEDNFFASLLGNLVLPNNSVSVTSWTSQFFFRK